MWCALLTTFLKKGTTNKIYAMKVRLQRSQKNVKKVYFASHKLTSQISEKRANGAHGKFHVDAYRYKVYWHRMKHTGDIVHQTLSNS